MNFIHPWAILFGAVAAGLPIAIHFLTRPRPVRLPFSTVRFVREAVQARQARNRLRDWIVLALRTAAVLLLAWVIARPMFGSQPQVLPGESGAAIRVVLLDVSQSMGAEQGGIQVFERARALAARYLASQADLEANLLLAAAQPRPVFDRFSNNFAVLRSELANVKPRPERLRIQPALQLAGEMLAQTGAPRRELVVISDFQRSNWIEGDFSVLPKDTKIQLESVAAAEALPNLAILRVGSQGRLERGQEVRLDVEIGNFTPEGRPLAVEVTLDNAVYRLEGACRPGSTVLSTQVPLPRAGWLTGEAKLQNVTDALPGDNTRPLVLEVRPPPTYVLLTREAADLRPSASYFLERALVPRADRQRERVLRMDPAHLDRETLVAADVVILASPGRLSNEAIQLLATLARRGRGIFYVANEPADVPNLQYLSEAAGRDLQMPVEFALPPAGAGRRNLFLAEVRKDVSPFNIFGDTTAAITRPLRFSGGLVTRQREGALQEDVRATFNDRTACLVVTTCGQGMLAVLNCDLNASNLAPSPAFVPLIGELLGMFGRRRQNEALACGEPEAIYLPPSAGAAAGLQLLGPAPNLGQVVDEDAGVRWRWPADSPPGVYQAQRPSGTVFAFAAAIPAVESDLRPLEPSVIQERLAGGRSLHYRAAGGDDEENDTLWSWLAVGLVGCLLGEVMALKLFRT